MTTKRIGQILVPIGVVILLLSLVIDYLGLGDSGFGASQIFGLEVGIATQLMGLFFIFLYPNKEFHLSSTIKNGLASAVSLPVSTWIIISFFFTSFLYFILPVFINSRNVMWYFVNYLPEGDPIGLDINSQLRYIQNWLILGQSPYFDNFILYPPLAMILFAPLLMVGYPANYYFITFLTLFCHTISFFLILLFLRKKENKILPVLFFAVSLFSYGFQFELERGQFNVIAYSLCLVAIFIYHLNDYFRYPAYILFTIGVQLKIYPFVLIFMFVKDIKDWKSNLKRLLGISLLNFLLLFIAGYQIFMDFLHSMIYRQRFATFWDWNHSLNAFVHQLAFDGFGLVSTKKLLTFAKYQDLYKNVLFIILGLCLAIVLIQSYLKKRNAFNPYLLLVCTILALVVPSTSNDYKLPILTIPIAFLFCTIDLPNKLIRRIVAILLILVISTAYWTTQYPLIVKSGLLSRNFPPLFLILVATTVLGFVAPQKAEDTGFQLQ